MKGIEYPVKIKDISKFESQNDGTAINVFALEKSNDINTLYPVYITNRKNRLVEIDLLYLEKNGNTHYCLIKDLSSIFNKNGNRVSICRNCLMIFSKLDAFRNHQEICIKHNYCKVMIPGRKTIKFDKNYFKSRLLVVIYADFESMNKKLSMSSPSDSRSYSNCISKQEVFSCGIYIKSDYNNLIIPKYHTYTGIDAAEKFVEDIIRIYNNISNKLNNYSKARQRVKLTKLQQQEFDEATQCYICKREFDKDITKIREHNHFNGVYREAACQSCNTNEGKASKKILVFFHNGSGYDFYFITTELLEHQERYNKVDVLYTTPIFWRVSPIITIQIFPGVLDLNMI